MKLVEHAAAFEARSRISLRISVGSVRMISASVSQHCRPGATGSRLCFGLGLQSLWSAWRVRGGGGWSCGCLRIVTLRLRGLAAKPGVTAAPLERIAFCCAFAIFCLTLALCCWLMFAAPAALVATELKLRGCGLGGSETGLDGGEAGAGGSTRDAQIDELLARGVRGGEVVVPTAAAAAFQMLSWSSPYLRKLSLAGSGGFWRMSWSSLRRRSSSSSSNGSSKFSSSEESSRAAGRHWTWSGSLMFASSRRCCWPPEPVRRTSLSSGHPTRILSCRIFGGAVTSCGCISTDVAIE